MWSSRTSPLPITEEAWGSGSVSANDPVRNSRTGSVRRWPRKAPIDAGPSPGTSSAEHAEKRRLKRELAEMRRALRMCGVPPKHANRVHIFGGTPFITTGANR